MARILAYTSPARGHLYPLTAILSECRDRGHEVVVRTLAAEVPLMIGQGFTAAPISPQVEALAMRDWQARGSRAALAASVATFVARAKFDAEDLAAAIAQEQPDAVVVDINSWGALAAAERWGGPWASFCPYPMALRSAGVPPFGPGLAPARSPLGRLRDKVLGPVVMGAISAKMLPGVNQVRRAVAVPALGHLEQLFLRPPLVLYLTAEPFEYHRADLPDSVVQVGPCPWEPPGAAPAWLADFEGPIVLVTTSSEFQDDGRLVRAALEGLADEPVRVVATVPAGSPEGYAVAGNARVERFAPHLPLLARSACAVTHGGMGATQKALSLGVPVCAVPFGRDQFEVARRVAVAGAGTRLPARRLTPEGLRRAVHQAIGMRAGAERVAAGYAGAGGPSGAAAALEDRLLGGRGRMSSRPNGATA